MIEILIASLFSSIILLTFGNIFQKLIFNQNIYANKNFSENSIYGVIFLSFLVLIINFIFPINKIIGNIICIFGMVIFLLFFFNSKYKKKINLLFIFYYINYFFSFNIIHSK